ncbi:condensation domain-containing protein, partial [Streptomyces sp. YS-3]|uniref:condensation domain-containing protein n=1 Tax=Streptomyces sp. YS-3 TaxID=3381352 RepID=UPI003862D070
MGYERRRPDQSLSPGVGLRPRDVRDVATGRVKFDLDVQISAAKEDSVLYVEYSSDLFDQWRIEQLLDHFEHITATAVADPTLPLHKIQPTGQEARDDLIERLTGPERPTPAALLHELFEQQVRVAPARVAAECPDGTVSYAELNTQADAVAEKLRRAGVRAGER